MNPTLDKTGFDLDGVIADTAETFLKLACEKIWILLLYPGRYHQF